jgi:hypothetical protein
MQGLELIHRIRHSVALDLAQSQTVWARCKTAMQRFDPLGASVPHFV